MLAEFEPLGLAPLGVIADGMKQLTTRVPVTIPNEVAGFTFVGQPSPVISAQVAAVDAGFTTLSPEETVVALRDGVLDGTEATWSEILSRGLYAHLAQAIATNHGYRGYGLLASPAFLDSLGDDDRALVDLAVEITLFEQNRFAYGINEVIRIQLRREGVPIHELQGVPRARSGGRCSFRSGVTMLTSSAATC